MSLRNETGSEIVTQINGEPIRLSSGQTSEAFILAWGNQTHWTKEIRAGGCTYLYMALGYERGLNLPAAVVKQKPTVLTLDGDFRLAATDANAEPLGAVTPERRCR